MRVLMLLLALQIPLGLDRGLLAPPDNPVTSEKAALGRRLFEDPRLSVDQSRACSDCHQADHPVEHTASQVAAEALAEPTRALYLTGPDDHVVSLLHASKEGGQVLDRHGQVGVAHEPVSAA